MSRSNQSWFDRFSRYASTRFRGNATLTTADLSLFLTPQDTELLILDQKLGQVLGIGQDDPGWYQPAKKLFLEIQLTGLAVNKTWQGDLIVKGDLFKTNTAGTLPGLM